MKSSYRGRAVAACLLLLTVPAGAQNPTQRLEEASFLTIGGIGQWVTIRADDRRHPLLLLLHGGPGDVQSPFVSTYAPYERDFVLVQWDQRGAGRTFGRNGATEAQESKTVATAGNSILKHFRRT